MQLRRDRQQTCERDSGSQEVSDGPWNIIQLMHTESLHTISRGLIGSESFFSEAQRHHSQACNPTSIAKITELERRAKYI